MLEKLPRRVTESRGTGAALLWWNAIDRLVESDVRFFPVQGAQQMIADGIARLTHRN